MKSPLVFGLGAVSGAVVAAAVLSLATAPERKAKDDEIAALKQAKLRAQQAAQGDREALRTVQLELQELQAAARRKPAAAEARPLAAPKLPENSAMAKYLGAPVSPPAGLDDKYSPEELASVFRDLADTLGIKVEKLAVDTTEFPFILHGRVESSAGGGFFRKIDSELRALPGYTYGGSVTGNTKDGSSYFALNMTPSSAYPREQAEEIQRRLMVRLQIAAHGWENEPP